MALKNVLDPTATSEALAKWWRQRNPRAEDVAVSNLEVPKSSGMSSETVLARLECRLDGRKYDQDLAIRLIHPDGQVFPSHDFELESAAMELVRSTTSCAVPKVYGIEHDASTLGAPFLVMQRLNGDVLPDDPPPFTEDGWLFALTSGQQARLFENALGTLAEIHRADVSSLRQDILGHPADSRRPIVQHIEHWRELYRWTAKGRAHPTIDVGLAWLDANIPASDPPAVLCWGDARLGNLMFGPDQSVTGVLDWELVSLGPAELDLGWFNFINRVYSDGFAIPLPPGFPSENQALQRYAELSDHTPQDTDFYRVFAGVRLCIVLMRLGTMMIDAGMLPADASLPISNPMSHQLATVLGVEQPDASATWVTGHR